MKKITAYIILLLFLASCAHPVARFTYDPQDAEVPADIQFNNESEKADLFHWDFGDGQSSDAANPQHQYSQSGNYEVVLTAKNKKGQENKRKARVMVKAPKKCLVKIHTDYGTILVELYDETPKHRDNFYKLAEEGYYDGLLFHRVIDGFMIQGGDPDSKDAPEGQQLGGGGPGHTIDAEFHPELIHVQGALAAARQGDQVNPEKKSSGSQFYIVHGRSMTEKELKNISSQMGTHYTDEQVAEYLKYGGTPFLDMEYTVFGRVVDGLDVVGKIAAQPGDGLNRPNQDIEMRVEVVN